MAAASARETVIFPVTATSMQGIRPESVITGELENVMTDESHEFLRIGFEDELGANVRKVNMIPITLKMEIPTGQESGATAAAT